MQGSVEHRFRVRYVESDQMGYAHHSAFIVWFEAGRIEWLREHGFSYRELETQGILMPVIDVQVQYKKPLRFDDEVLLRTGAKLLGRSRICFTSTVHVGASDEIRCAGSVTVACVNSAGKPQRLPETLAALLPIAP
jgi:acyl-CoA thioester hydrolase